jgi:hypothetical protein
MMMRPDLYIDEFFVELRAQLEQDHERWGDTWAKRPRKGQGDRIFDRLRQYYNDARLGKELLMGNEDTPVFVDSLPWMKIAGLALIGWIRDRYPDEFPDH